MDKNSDKIIEGLLDLMKQLERDSETVNSSTGTVYRSANEYIYKLFCDRPKSRVQTTKDWLTALKNKLEEGEPEPEKIRDASQKTNERIVVVTQPQNLQEERTPDALITIQTRIDHLEKTIIENINLQTNDLKKEISNLGESVSKIDVKEITQTLVSQKVKNVKENSPKKNLEEDCKSIQKGGNGEEKQVNEKKKEVFSVKLSDTTLQKMQKLAKSYNDSRRFRTNFILALPSAEVNARENNPSKTEEEKFHRATSLERAEGNPNYYGEPVEKENDARLFVFPVKSIAVNSDSLWTNAYAYFFEIKNKESIQPKDGISPYVLVRPAIVEKRQNDEYQLLVPGCIELR